MSTTPRRRHPVAWILFLAFVAVPLVEVYVLVQVGQVIGAWWTVLLLVLSGIVGSWLMRREGSRAWRGLTTALSSGRMPGRELADGALVLVGGTLMLTPGFVSDVVGILLILPLTRPVARRLLARLVTRRLVVAGADATRPGHSSGDRVVRGEVVDD
jgi:UPF0716 protein FxsA